jgi:predicted nucleic acid-binding protein
MILVDSAIWMDHFRQPDERLKYYLLEERVVTHPHIIGEVSLGYLKNRRQILDLLYNLTSVLFKESHYFLNFIDLSY